MPMISDEQRTTDAALVRAVHEAFMPEDDETFQLIVDHVTYVEVA